MELLGVSIEFIRKFAADYNSALSSAAAGVETWCVLMDYKSSDKSTAPHFKQGDTVVVEENRFNPDWLVDAVWRVGECA